jgi:uncharacterized LabA/DUF88 family protein
MDRYVLFVDAAYLFAAGGELCHGTKRRNELEMNFDKAVSELREICRKDSGLNPLRVYWYDAAADARATPAQLKVAALEGVQLRLGRLTARGQKGVDSRIVRDLIVLAHNRACTDAYLVSGDDDLREGLSEAQEAGVSVKLIGVEPLSGFQNQAPTLVRAADGTLTLSKDQILQFLHKRSGTTALAPPYAAAAPATVDDARKAGIEFARDWFARATKEEQELARSHHPDVPKNVDYQLLAFGEARVGQLNRGSPLRAALREGFRSVIKPANRMS